MGRLSRYRTALTRYRHGKGFGIHSPFAFGFVLKVLRERNPYYSYEHLEALRAKAISRTRHHFRHPRIISLKNAKLIFRVANFFNPMDILQVGTSYGVSTASVLAVAGKSRLILCEPHLGRYRVAEEVIAGYGGRVRLIPGLGDAIEHYRRSLSGVGEPADLTHETPAEQAARRTMQPFILINNVESAADIDTILPFLEAMAHSDATVIMRNLNRNPLMAQMWKTFAERSGHGMSFTNERIGVFVANRKLPRQDYLVWF